MTAGQRLAAAAALLVAALLAAALAGCGPDLDVATYEVARRPFRHQVTAEGYLRAAKVTRLTVPSEVEWRVRLAWLAPEGRVEEGDLIARFDRTDMEIRLREGRLDLESAELATDKTRAESESRRARHKSDLSAAELDLDHARRFQLSDASLYSRHEIVESQIDETLASERKEHARSAQETESSLGATEVDLLEIDKRRARLKIEQAERGLRALEVRAPHAGILTWARNWRGEPVQVGQEMFTGQTVAEIPDLAALEAEVFVLEADAGGLAADRAASVILEAHPERAYAARIHHVDAVAKPRFRGSPVQYFGVVLELVESAGLPPRPGQRVRATLVLEELAEALVVPRQAIFADGDAKRVYVKNGKDFEARTVELGAQSMGLAVVISGLEAGEVVALQEPPRGGEAEGSPASSPAPATASVGAATAAGGGR